MKPTAFIQRMVALLGFSGCVLTSAIANQPQLVLSPGAGTTWSADWDGVSGRTYFFQCSTDLTDWMYAPFVEFGNGPISYGIDCQGSAKMFVRLKYVDDPGITTLQAAQTADMDDDGLNNLTEVQNYGTDPFLADTSGDGLPDGWSAFFGLDPLSDNAASLFQGGPLTNLQAFTAGVQALPGASDTDHDGDGIDNDEDSTPTVPDEYRLEVTTTTVDVERDQGGEVRETTEETTSYSLDQVADADTCSIDHVPGGGELRTSTMKLIASAADESQRQVTMSRLRFSFLGINYSSIYDANAVVDRQPDLTFTIPAQSTQSQQIAVDPGFTDLDNQTPTVERDDRFLYTNLRAKREQIGQLGDRIPSNQGADGEKHFVTPKVTNEIDDDVVILEAAGLEPAAFTNLVKWEGGDPVPGEPHQRRVPRDAAAKTTVKVLLQDDDTELDLLNVWVVWATMTARTSGATFSPNSDLSFDDYTMTQLGPHEEQFTFTFQNLDGTIVNNHYHAFIAGIEWKSTIAPTSMFDLAEDVPDLTKLTPKVADPLLTYDDGRSYYALWDIPRDRKRTRITDGTIWDQEMEWKNDDDSNTSRDEDPYEQDSSGPSSSEIFSVDNPGPSPIRKEVDGQPDEYVPDATTFEVRHVFQEWTRLQLGEKWYDISDKMDWYSNASCTRNGAQWTRDNITIGTGIEAP